MNELSLFSGAGGGLLGSKLLGWRTIGYVEYEPYCQEVLKARIADGILDAAPIFGNIRKFISEGYAESYQGMVDIVTGGFPCQPFSVAGKQAGESDARNMWPATISVIRLVRPHFVFLENVPGLLTDKYMGRIFGDLAESGYSFRWTCLGADDVGANHRRKRLWILAYSISNGRTAWGLIGRRTSQEWINPPSIRKQKSDPSNFRQSGLDVADSERKRLVEGYVNQKGSPTRCSSKLKGWWSVEPNVGRVADELAIRLDSTRGVR